ncbi:MAG: glycosyltransferase family 2 protein [Proteobacteria bacterium]|nr:glycosyltransferase family 2 protein [Pseudomonadota bacterium]
MRRDFAADPYHHFSKVADAPIKPLVAIVTPVYNGAATLQETMACVQAQTYDNIVHCMLDNASDDGTAEIIARFRNGRVPLIVARNDSTLPVIANWNAALCLIPSGAAFFRVLSADDTIEPDCISSLVAAAGTDTSIRAVACFERLGTTVIGASMPPGTVFDGGAIVRGTLRKALDFPYHHCLFRVPDDGVPEGLFATTHHSAPLLCSDIDAAMRLILRGRCALVREPLGATSWPGKVTAAELLPVKMGIWSHLQLIDRLGPTVFDSATGYMRCRYEFLQHYYVHLLAWRLRGEEDIVRRHIDFLGRAAALPRWRDYAVAAVAWPARRVIRRFLPMRLALEGRPDGSA